MSEASRVENTVEVVERPGLDAAEVALVEERVELTPFEFRRPWMRAFVAVLARTGDVASAARAAKINYRYVYTVRVNDPTFREAWAEAEKVATGLMEQIAIRRATVGEQQTVIRTTEKYDETGTLVERTVVEETQMRRSDALLMFMLRARRPDLYREKVDHRVTGGDGGPVEVEVYRRLDPERAAALALLFAESASEGNGHPDIDASANGHSAAA